MDARRAAVSEVDSPAAWRRLWFTVVLATIGGVGMWSFPVALPAVQAAFGVVRADAALPFTLCMLGFALGGVVMGRLVDRFGVAVPLAIGVVATGVGYIAAGTAPTLWVLALAHVLVGIGASATFGPLMADASQWFLRRRGIAVAIAAAGNYLAGMVWPPILQYFIANVGWRETHIGIGVFCAVTMLPLVLAFRRPAPMQPAPRRPRRARHARAASKRAAGAPVHRRHRLLRRHVDAAGAHRRLLRRPRLRRRARRRDAVADAGLRHRQPHRLRIHRRPHRADLRRCCSAPCCRASRSCSICSSRG